MSTLSERVKALRALEWLAILAVASVVLALLLAPFVWLTVSLILTFAFQEWTNALSLPVGRAAVAAGVVYYARDAWKWLVEMRREP